MDQKQFEFSKIHWNRVTETGFPPRELWVVEVRGKKIPRVFVCLVGYAVCLRIASGDERGFMDEDDICQGEEIEAWAVFDSF
ncbi:hypothetical protein [Aquabacterium sp.]|uniref:hypothetical protein n=1 Tax=Aquabacterium sp. TaxID=1872578 RepID=UPI0035AEC565